MPSARSSLATQMATYVLDVDTNIKGEFGLVAPQLTEALQTAFSEKRDVFKILERRHLDQLVKANQLEKDLQAISHGEPASPQFVRQVRADGFIRGELIDGPDGVVLTVTLVNLNSEVMWEGQAKESRAGWLLHDTQTKDAAKLAGEAEVHFRPSNPSRDMHGQPPASPVSQQVPTQSSIPATAQEPSLALSSRDLIVSMPADLGKMAVILPFPSRPSHCPTNLFGLSFLRSPVICWTKMEIAGTRRIPIRQASLGAGSKLILG
jgi:hypothetical protein